MMNGTTLSRRWNVDVRHALFSRTGNWYHRLRRFPAALFDPEGYVLFETEEDYLSCSQLSINQDIWVPRGISSIPSYVRVVIDGVEHVPAAAPSTPASARRVHYEGNPVCVELTRYERDRGARAECLDYYGHRCSVCDFDFPAAYGEVAQEMIHVHHLVPIAEVGATYALDPVRDLRPICPNCHAVIHKRRPPFTLEEVKAMLNRAKASA